MRASEAILKVSDYSVQGAFVDGDTIGQAGVNSSKVLCARVTFVEVGLALIRK